MISIIVPVYNVRDCLCRCVDSLLAQDYTDYEIILVDDGSTDGSSRLCDQLATDYAQIRVVHQSNSGLSAARNAGIKRAHGDYLTFVDSDDAVAVNFLSTLLNLLMENKTEIAACTFAEISTRGKQRNFVSPDQLPRLLSPEACLKAMLLEADGLSLSACAKLYARKLFQKVSFPAGKLYEDVGTTYKLIMSSKKIAYLPQPLYYYYANPNSIIHQEFNFAKLDLISLTDQMCAEIAQKYPRLVSVTNLRRMHARFSILRQMVLVRSKASQSEKFRSTEQEIITYLRARRADILRNPNASVRDRLAMLTLLMGKPIFALSWRIYNLR